MRFVADSPLQFFRCRGFNVRRSAGKFSEFSCFGPERNTPSAGSKILQYHKGRKMEPAKILVVEDNDTIRYVVTKMLSRLGYDVSSTCSGESGLSIFLKNKFDIVLSDYEMPGMDGVALAYSIKQHRPAIPFVIMTGGGKGHFISRNIGVVDEVISKPFTLEELDKTIQNLYAKIFEPALFQHASVQRSLGG
jgi:CheY-like chemotaxis protein